jgi:hypothetical protein
MSWCRRCSFTKVGGGSRGDSDERGPDVNVDRRALSQDRNDGDHLDHDVDDHGDSGTSGEPMDPAAVLLERTP